MTEISKELEELLQEWSVETLEGIGVFKSKIPNYEELQEKIKKQLRSTYSDVAIMKFLKRKDYGKLEYPDGFAQVTGPCGDTMEIYLKIKDGGITDASYQTDGCHSSNAAGGMMVEMIRGKNISQADEFTQQDVLDALGGFPEENEHCALLAVNTLKEALKSIKQ